MLRYWTKTKKHLKYLENLKAREDEIFTLSLFLVLEKIYVTKNFSALRGLIGKTYPGLNLEIHNCQSFNLGVVRRIILWTCAQNLKNVDIPKGF